MNEIIESSAKSILGDGIRVTQTNSREGGDVFEFRLISRQKQNDNIPCLRLFIVPHEGYINISHFNHYADLTFGTNLLTLIDNLAKQIDNIKCIKYSDCVSCAGDLGPHCAGAAIPAYQIDIVTTGQSWFNENKYYSEQYNFYESNNRFISRTRAKNMLRWFEEFIHDEFIHDENPKDKDILLHMLSILLPLSDDEIVKFYFSRLVKLYNDTERNNNNSNCYLFKFLYTLLYFLFRKGYLNYHSQLMKCITKNQGGKKRSIKRI